jgi:Putative peptidoglycan binding domain
MIGYETKWHYLKRKRADTKVMAREKARRRLYRVVVPNAGKGGLYRGCKFTGRVMQLQLALNTALDTQLVLDGDYGKYTQMVVILFQWRTGMPTHGRYDAATEQALRRFLEK